MRLKGVIHRRGGATSTGEEGITTKTDTVTDNSLNPDGSVKEYNFPIHACPDLCILGRTNYDFEKKIPKKKNKSKEIAAAETAENQPSSSQTEGNTTSGEGTGDTSGPTSGEGGTTTQTESGSGDQNQKDSSATTGDTTTDSAAVDSDGNPILSGSGEDGLQNTGDSIDAAGGKNEEEFQSDSEDEEPEIEVPKSETRFDANVDIVRKTNFQLACIVQELTKSVYPEEITARDKLEAAGGKNIDDDPNAIAPEASQALLGLAVPKTSSLDSSNIQDFEFPVRLVLNGKPLCGKKTLGFELCDKYNLKLLQPEQMLHEALSFAGRPEPGTMDALNVAALQNAEAIAEEAPGGALNKLKELGLKALELLDEGEVLPPWIYVELIAMKLKSLKASVVKERRENPEGSACNGWILLGFPTTAEEMILFEKKLSEMSSGGLNPGEQWIPPEERPNEEFNKRAQVCDVLVPGKPVDFRKNEIERGVIDGYCILEGSCEVRRIGICLVKY